MSGEWQVPGWLGVGVLAAVLILGALALRAIALAARQRAVLTALREEQAALRLALGETVDRLARLERRAARAASGADAEADHPGYLITHLGFDDDPTSSDAAALPVEEQVSVTRVDGPLFADLVLRESVVQAVSFAHGVRRALAPETRNRIRYEMRREVKRSRRQRRADLRAAKRAFEDRQRETVTP